MLDNVYTQIYQIINPILNAYQDYYPYNKEKQYPYCEYQISNIIPNDNVSNNYLLQIDVWDNKGTDTEEINTLTANLFNALVDKKIRTDDFFISIYRNNPVITNLPDPEISIQRKQIKLIMTIYQSSIGI